MSGHFPRKRFVSTFTVLALFGATAYGIYSVYEWFTVFPSELRGDLRAGIKALHNGDFLSSELYLRRAWYNCDTIARKRFGSDPWLKLSGIACKLGEVLEGAHKPDQAYQVYTDCLSLMSRQNGRLSIVERQRAVAIAMHSAELACTLGMQDEEEKWLIWSVIESFEISTFPSKRPDNTPHPSAADLPLPDWIYTETLDAAVDALAFYYAKIDDPRLAYQGYSAATQIMLKSARLSEMTPRRYCKLALLVNNALSSQIAYRSSPENLEILNRGFQPIIQDIEGIRRGLPVPEPVCESVWSTLLFNYGSVLEMQNKREEAREHYEHARTHAQSVGIPEGLRQADNALARLSAQDSANDQIER